MVSRLPNEMSSVVTVVETDPSVAETPAADWLRRQYDTARRSRWWPRTRQDRSAALVLLVAVLANLWLVGGGGLYVDDVRAQAYAQGRTFWPFVIESNGTHLSPGARTVDWLMATYAPLDHWPAIVIGTLLLVALGCAAWRVLRLVVRSPRARLLGLAWVLLAPTMVPTYAWFRQSLTTLPPVIATLVAVPAMLAVAHGANNRLRAATYAVLALVLGLMFSERAIVIPFVVAVGVLVTSPWRQLRARAGAVGLPWLVMVTVDLLYLLTYSRGAYDQGNGGHPTAAGLAASTARSLVVDTVPGLLGGPLAWRASSNAVYSFAATPAWFAVLANVLLVAVLVAAYTANRRRTAVRERAMRPGLWATCWVVLAYAVPIWLIIYLGRVSRVDDVTSVDDLRLFADVAVGVAIAVASVVSAFLTLLGRRLGPARVGVARAGASALVVATTISWLGFGHAWHTGRTTSYVANLSEDLRGPGTHFVVPSPVPNDIVPAWVQVDFSSGSLVKLLSPQTQTATGASPLVVDAQGHLAAARLHGVTSAVVPKGFCGRGMPAGVQVADVAFPQVPPMYRGQLVRIGLLVGDTTTITVRAMTTSGLVDVPAFDHPVLQRGAHRLVLPLPGAPVSGVQVRLDRPNTAGVCVTSVEVVVPPAG